LSLGLNPGCNTGVFDQGCAIENIVLTGRLGTADCDDRLLFQA